MTRDPLVLEKVKGILKMISELAPGHAVELRIPPYSAIQCVEGPKHTRGTPPNVVEMQAETLFLLAQGENIWKSSIENGAIHASGERSDLESLFQDLAIRMHP
jgi:Bacterial SCP ortholog